jgi:predicted nucleic acid-binding Zn ribbon protein
MKKASDLLGRVARKLNRPEAGLAWLSSSWPQIVGKTLADHTRPLQCENGRLEIYADAKAWQKQLDHMTRDFCARINEAWGSSLIREVKFVVTKPSAVTLDGSYGADKSGAVKSQLGPRPKRLPYELDNDHTPFIRRRK